MARGTSAINRQQTEENASADHRPTQPHAGAYHPSGSFVAVLRRFHPSVKVKRPVELSQGSSLLAWEAGMSAVELREFLRAGHRVAPIDPIVSYTAPPPAWCCHEQRFHGRNNNEEVHHAWWYRCACDGGGQHQRDLGSRSPAPVSTGKQACKASGQAVVNVNYTYMSTDSGLGGNDWANDTINRQIQIWQVVGGYCAAVKDQGSFVTMGRGKPRKHGPRSGRDHRQAQRRLHHHPVDGHPRSEPADPRQPRHLRPDHPAELPELRAEWRPGRLGLELPDREQRLVDQRVQPPRQQRRHHRLRREPAVL